MDSRWTEARLEELRASRIEPTRLIAEAIAGAPKKAALVSASAVGIYGMRTDDETLDETGAHGTDVLARLCDDWEAAARPAASAGARVALARIGIVLGKRGGALAEMLPPYRAFVGGPLGGGAQWVSWVHEDDVVRALLLAIDRLEGPFNVTAPEPVTMDALARAIGRATGRPSFFRVPAFALRALLGERAAVLLTGQRVVPRHLEREGFAFAFTSLDAALADILAS
jgi:uncharacterized protein (TIGR01777 family)